MSKEIAQTVGGKRIAWLVAIVAAFVIFATVGSQFREANALGEGGVTLAVTQTPSGTANVAAGGAVVYTVAVTPVGVPIADGYVEINPDVDFTVTTATFAIAPSAATGSCTLVTGNTYLCHVGALNLASTATITLTGTATAAGSGATILPFVTGNGDNTAAELEILVRDGIADATPADDIDTYASTGTLTVIGLSTGAVVKQDTSVAVGGGAVSQTITVLNNSGADFDGTSITVSDAIATAGLTVNTVTAASGNVGGVALSAVNCGAAGATTPFTIVCAINFTAGDFDNTDSVVLTVGFTAAANTGAARSFTDTATVTATAATFAVTSNDTGTITQGSGIVAAALPALCGGLYHLDAQGNLVIGGIDLGTDGVAGGVGGAADCTYGVRDTDNNVVGFNHNVCFVPGVGQTAVTNPVAIIPPAVTLTGSQTAFRIDYVSGTPNVNGQNLRLISPANTDTEYSNGANLTCVQWYSTGAGEQNVTVIDVAGEVVADFADGPTNGLDVVFGGIENGLTPLVKEWNLLVPTTITGSSLTVAGALAAYGTILNLDGLQGTLGVTFNPATGTYQNATGISVYENVLAQHTNNFAVGTYFGQGALVTFKNTGTCGNIAISGGFVTGAIAPFDVNNPRDTVTNVINSGNTASVPTTGTTVTTTGAGPIMVTLSAPVGGNCVLLGGATIAFTAQANYPNNLGSITPIPLIETYSVRLTTTLPTKQVFLAWAGQRVILEHDWRIPAGDTTDGTDAGVIPDAVTGSTCPLAGATIDYIKGGGPGNFLNAIPNPGTTPSYVVIAGNDMATVTLGSSIYQDGTPGILRANTDNCISRVLYESEDQGEVDIEVLPRGIPGGKVAIVVYYMKFNTVSVSLVTQVFKPTHNSSIATIRDFAPGNPWDASKDATDNKADWNVSRDLLVRGRISGWFTNSNPSGRAADTTDPLNVLPANRWVMPADWALLAGGPADAADNSRTTGTAETFRPEYDIMVNPGRIGRGLDTPEGGAAFATSTVLTAATDATQITMSVSYSLFTGAGTNIGVGSTLRIDNEEVIVLGLASTPVAAPNPALNALGNVLTFYVQRGANATGPTAHVVGSVVTVKSSFTPPFEGPYSLLDITSTTSFTTSGLGSSAAISAYAPGLIRDTIWKDGDVDWWDAPMPPALTTVDLRGTGFIKQVIKSDVYYLGTPNGGDQNYPNPYYIQDIPDSPFIPAVEAGGGYFWDTWGNDGPGGAGQGAYRFWLAMPTLIATVPGVNPFGISDGTVSSLSQQLELLQIRAAYGDTSIGRTLVVYSDNHGEFMVIANGDYKTDLSACATNTLAGGKHCKPGDKVGAGTVYATADYPDFRGKHFPVKSNVATITWTWGGYKDVTVEAGETDQYKYVVFHAMDRDGFCYPTTGATLLHSVLSSVDAVYTINGDGTANAGDPIESVNFLIDSGEGIILGTSGYPASNAAVAGGFLGVGTPLAPVAVINDGRQFATTVPTYSIYLEAAAASGKKVFPVSPLAATGQTDECQAWIKVSNSLLGVLNVLAVAADDEGPIGFDKIIDLTNTTSYTLNFRWSLVTWAGADGITINDAIKGTGTTGKNPGGNDISASVTAIYGWDQAAQQWLGFFPSGVNVPGANDLTSLKAGQAFWIAITGPSSVTWTIASNVS